MSSRLRMSKWQEHDLLYACAVAMIARLGSWGDRFFVCSSVFIGFHVILNIDLLFKLFRFRLRSSSTKSSALWLALMNTPPAWHSRCRPALVAQQDDFCYKARLLVWFLLLKVRWFLWSGGARLFRSLRSIQAFAKTVAWLRGKVPNWAELASPVSSKMLVEL